MVILWYEKEELGMENAVKIAISLPADVFQAAEGERRLRRESRSEFYRHAIEAFLRREGERVSIERYVRGYADQPETPEDVAAAHAAAAALAAEPWE